VRRQRSVRCGDVHEVPRQSFEQVQLLVEEGKPSRLGLLDDGHLDSIDQVHVDLFVQAGDAQPDAGSRQEPVVHRRATGNEQRPGQRADAEHRLSPRQQEGAGVPTGRLAMSSP
jgi:hypothetical protein